MHDSDATLPNAKRSKTMEPSKAPKHQRLYAEASGLPELTPDTVDATKLKELKHKRKASLHPAYGENKSTPKYLFNHDFQNPLPEEPDEEDRQESL